VAEWADRLTFVKAVVDLSENEWRRIKARLSQIFFNETGLPVEGLRIQPSTSLIQSVAMALAFRVLRKYPEHRQDGEH